MLCPLHAFLPFLTRGKGNECLCCRLILPYPEGVKLTKPRVGRKRRGQPWEPGSFHVNPIRHARQAKEWKRCKRGAVQPRVQAAQLPKPWV
jgi:hypothetical protein